MNEPNLHKTSQILRWKKASIAQLLYKILEEQKYFALNISTYNTIK